MNELAILDVDYQVALHIINYSTIPYITSPDTYYLPLEHLAL